MPVHAIKIVLGAFTHYMGSVLSTPQKHFLEAPKYTKINFSGARPWTPLGELIVLSRRPSCWEGARYPLIPKKSWVPLLSALLYLTAPPPLMHIPL